MYEYRIISCIQYFFYKQTYLIQEIGFCYIINFNLQSKKKMDKDYICGCGKAYGSYPAFSTHRKAKHQNITVPGTVLPTQQKAKRGRPSCDFKKIPELDERKKEYYQGLNLIQYGLLDLQQKYKGKILSQPHQSNQQNLNTNIQTSIRQYQQRRAAIATFTKLITVHTQSSISLQIITFFTSLIQYGLETSQLTSIHVYNNYCLRNIKQLYNSQLGIGFYIDICLLLSKWLCVMGYERQILRVKNRDQYSTNYRNNEIIDNEDNQSSEP